MLRFVPHVVSIGLMLAYLSNATAQVYPNKPIRILANGPGSGVDYVARVVAQGLTNQFGLSVIVENRGGSIIVAEVVAKAPPDGYTILLSGTLWMNPLLQSNLSWDPVRDFQPITLVIRQPNVLVVHPALPVKTVKELITLAKARPGELNYASAGSGGSPHLAAELFKSMAGVSILRIPDKSAGPAMNDLLGGQIQIMFGTGGIVDAHLASKRLRALGITSLQPSALFPGMPVLSASGVPGYEYETIYGIFAPAKTPAAIINRLNLEIVRFINDTEVKTRLLNVGIEPVGSSADELATRMKTEMVRMGKVIKDAGIRAE